MKLWGGRFSKDTSPLMERFSASIRFDGALFEEDIEGSKAHAGMLRSIGILTDDECRKIEEGLDEIRQEIAQGKFVFTDALEDIHMHIESRLIEKIGDTAKKLHTGRSRNDQVSLDMRMFLKKELARLDGALRSLMTAIIEKAGEEKATVMPGYTHMQRAQVVTFSHYILAYYAMFKRDRRRIADTLAGVDVLPLGSGALAGSTIPLDRERVRDLLGFGSISKNSMDTVGDRDFVMDSVYAAAMIMTHLSRLAEDLIIFSTQEFSFVYLPDEFCTGSSLMPHKKNPDAMELIRGKASRVMGDLVSLLILLKGLPMTYNRDLQEDKEPLFHAVSTAKDCLSVMEMCVRGVSINKERMEGAVREGFMAAVEMAEYLTKKGIPFREAHGIIGAMVKDCEDKGISFDDMKLEEMREYSLLFEEDIFDCIHPHSILKSRKTAAAASIEEVEKTIEREKIYLNIV